MSLFIVYAENFGQQENDATLKIAYSYNDNVGLLNSILFTLSNHLKRHLLWQRNWSLWPTQCQISRISQSFRILCMLPKQSVTRWLELSLEPCHKQAHTLLEVPAGFYLTSLRKPSVFSHISSIKLHIGCLSTPPFERLPLLPVIFHFPW